MPVEVLGSATKGMNGENPRSSLSFGVALHNLGI